MSNAMLAAWRGRFILRGWIPSRAFAALWGAGILIGECRN
jgi:hypothetical protein